MFPSFPEFSSILITSSATTTSTTTFQPKIYMFFYLIKIALRLLIEKSISVININILPEEFRLNYSKGIKIQFLIKIEKKCKWFPTSFIGFIIASPWRRLKQINLMISDFLVRCFKNCLGWNVRSLRR